jgi:hypothetical protein
LTCIFIQLRLWQPTLHNEKIYNKFVVKFFDQNRYDRDLMRPLDMSHSDTHNKFSNDEAINDIGEYEDDCTDDDDDGDNHEMHSSVEYNVNSLTPIPVNNIRTRQPCRKFNMYHYRLHNQPAETELVCVQTHFNRP